MMARKGMTQSEFFNLMEDNYPKLLNFANEKSLKIYNMNKDRYKIHILCQICEYEDIVSNPDEIFFGPLLNKNSKCLKDFWYDNLYERIKKYEYLHPVWIL